jgi:hypothetical protein
LRRPLLLALLALALMPATAAAEGYHVAFGMPAGGVTVSNFQDCPGETCEPVPISIALDRGNVGIVETAGPALDPHIATWPELGDVVRIYRDGAERAVAWYDPPTVEDTSCAVIGGTTLTGTLRRGEPGMQTISSPGYGLSPDPYTYVRVALWDTRVGLIESTLAVDGTRWTAQFPSPIPDDQSLLVTNAYTIASPVGSAVVGSTRGVPYCPAPPPPPVPLEPPPPPAAPCSAATLRGSEEFDAAVRRAVAGLRLKRLRRGAAALPDLLVCERGLVSASITTTGRRPAVVARGIRSTSGTRVTLHLVRTRRAARLAGRRRAAVKLVLRFRDSAGETLTWTKHLTLRAPRQ